MSIPAENSTEPSSQFMLAVPFQSNLHENGELVEPTKIIPEFAKKLENCSVPREGQSAKEHQQMVLGNIKPLLDAIANLPEKLNSWTTTEVTPAFEGDDINEFMIETQVKLKKELYLFTTSFIQTLPLICLGIYAYHTSPGAKEAIDLTTSLQSLGGVFLGPLCSFLNTVVAFSKWTRARERKMKLLKSSHNKAGVPLIVGEVPRDLPVAQGVPIANSSTDNNDDDDDADEEEDGENEEEDTPITPNTIFNGQVVPMLDRELGRHNHSETQSPVAKQAVNWLKTAIIIVGVVLAVCGLGALAAPLLRR